MKIAKKTMKKFQSETKIYHKSLCKVENLVKMLYLFKSLTIFIVFKLKVELTFLAVNIKQAFSLFYSHKTEENNVFIQCLYSK